MMKLKYCTLIVLFCSLSQVKAATRNLCDDLIEAGNTTAEFVKKCQDKHGVSAYALEKIEADKAKRIASDDKDAEAKRMKDNIEMKIFSKDELLNAGFGKPFFAVKLDYRYRPAKETKLTMGDALCSYLGYEKAAKSIVSPEIMPDAADKKGLYVDTTLGFNSREPDLYKDEDLRFTVRKFEEITCLRRKDKNIEGSADVYRKLTEDIMILPGINSEKGDPARPVNDGPRLRKTTNGYIQPVWTRDDPANGAGARNQ